MMSSVMSRGECRRANMAHIKQSRPDSVLGWSHLQCKSLYNHLSCSLFRRAASTCKMGRGHPRSDARQSQKSISAKSGFDLPVR